MSAAAAPSLLDSLHQLMQSGVAAGWLPAMLQYGFVINALVAGLLLGPLLGGLGTLVVVKRFAFFSEAVGHAALTGIAVPVALDIPVPSGAAIILCAGALFLVAVAISARRSQAVH